MKQKNLPLVLEKNYSKEDFIVFYANEEAFLLVENFDKLNIDFFIIIAPKAGGKTYLSHIFADRTNGKIFDSKILLKKDVANILKDTEFAVFEDIDAILKKKTKKQKYLFSELSFNKSKAEKKLFHLYNYAKENKKTIMLTSSIPISELDINMPDLKTRLSSVNTAEITKPDDDFLTNLLLKCFYDEQVKISPKEIDYILKNIERSFSKINDFVFKINEHTLSGKKITFSSLRQILHNL